MKNPRLVWLNHKDINGEFPDEYWTVSEWDCGVIDNKTGIVYTAKAGEGQGDIEQEVAEFLGLSK